MPEKLFFELDQDKQNKIFTAGLKEFASNSYTSASTNNIVKSAEISKGSLFKYFKNKEALYFYILDTVILSLSTDLMKESSQNSKNDFIDLIIFFAQKEFDWHIENPEKYKLIKKAFIEENSIIRKKINERYKADSESMFEGMLNSVETDNLRASKEKTSKIVKWILEGINNEYAFKIDSFENLDQLKKIYIEEIEEYMEILKKGIFK